jgi:hypothetical protein
MVWTRLVDGDVVAADIKYTVEPNSGAAGQADDLARARIWRCRCYAARRRLAEFLI